MRFFPSFNTFIEIGPLSIQWYAVCILTGAAIAYFLGQYHFKKLGYSKEILSDYVFGLLFVGIIGARIWYVIFMWNELYANGNHYDQSWRTCYSRRSYHRTYL